MTSASANFVLILECLESSYTTKKRNVKQDLKLIANM